MCKTPYLCPVENVTAVCGLDNRNYRSYCQVTSGGRTSTAGRESQHDALASGCFRLLIGPVVSVKSLWFRRVTDMRFYPDSMIFLITTGSFLSQLMALSCRTKRPAFSHFGEKCQG